MGLGMRITNKAMVFVDVDNGITHVYITDS